MALRAWATCNFIDFHLIELGNAIGQAGVVPKAALEPSTPDARADQLIAAHDAQPFVALLVRLARTDAPAAASAQDLAANLANAAKLVREIVADRLAEIPAGGADALAAVRNDFRNVLYAHPEAGGYPDKDFNLLFSAAFAQTLAFGLLLVREATGNPVDHNAHQHMPAEHPLMRSTLHVLGLPQVVDGIGIGFEVMLDTVNSFDASLLAQQPGGRDPILYFYEDFLRVFDPEARERYGVYYTPVEVVRYMVGALDRALRENLGTQGLRDPNVAILDPATGTGTFLLAIAQRVRDEANAAAGAGAAALALRALATRMFGFELLVGPNAVAHYRLHHALREPAVEGQPPPPPLPRLGIFLADTLARPSTEMPPLELGAILGEGIRDERAAANRVKSDQRVLAIIGNPPYRRLAEGEDETLVGRWMNEVWDDLKAPVRDAGWANQLNTFPELSVAFWRWAIWKLFESPAAPRRGVIAFITNRTFLAGKPYAGLRQMLRNRFDRIEVIDLRGDVRLGERAGIEGDQGVFNIQVGTSITIAIADGSLEAASVELPNGERQRRALATIRYTDSWETDAIGRRAKLDWLINHSALGRQPDWLGIDRSALADMKPVPFQQGDWVDLAGCFTESSSGLESKRDHVVYGFGNEHLEARLRAYLGNNAPDAAEQFSPTPMNSFEDAVATGVDPTLFRAAAYRPLDVRSHYPHRRFNDRLRTKLSAMWGLNNRALFAMPRGTNAGPGVWAHALYPDRHAFRGSYGGYAFPLYDHRPGHGPSNLSITLLDRLTTAYGADVASEDAFDAMLGLLSATSYTLRFAEDLEDVFPHVPFPADPAVFADAVRVGREIRTVETFARPPSPHYLTPALARLETMPTGPLAAVEWIDGELTLSEDGTGRVTGVPLAIWEFAVSGYRLLPRWLAARVGQPVDDAFVTAMRDVAGRIAELIDLFAEADTVLQATLGDTLTRDSLGFAAPEPMEATTDESDD